MATAANAGNGGDGGSFYMGDVGSLQCPSPPSLGLDGGAGDLPSPLGQGVRKPYKQCVSAGRGRYIVHFKHQHCCSICSTGTHSSGFHTSRCTKLQKAMKRNKVGNCATPGCWRVSDTSATASSSSCQAEPVGSARLPSEGGVTGHSTISAGSASGSAAATRCMVEATEDDRSVAKRSAFVDDRTDADVALDLYAMD